MQMHKKLVNNKFNVSLNALYAYRYDINTDFSQNHLINEISKQSANNFGWQADINMALDKKRRLFLGLQYETNWSDCGVNSTYFISSNGTKWYRLDTHTTLTVSIFRGACIWFFANC